MTSILSPNAADVTEAVCIHYGITYIVYSYLPAKTIRVRTKKIGVWGKLFQSVMKKISHFGVAGAAAQT